MMIIVKLTGGIGNQMFQYAFAMQIAEKHNTTILLDLEKFSKENIEKHEKFWLSVFCIRDKIATKKQIFFFKRKTYFKSKFIFNVIKFILQKNKISQKEFEYKKNYFINSKKSSYIDGYWQSEKFFKDIENKIRQIFTFPKLNEKNIQIAEKIYNSNSVSIHFRRGDYISNHKNLKNHGICSINYYKKAVKLITQKINNAVFFIFSDDIDFVKQNFIIKNKLYYIDWNTDNESYNDIHLMSLCKHNIIANSSFSWWGAWLNKNPNKIVIAPKKWFNERDWDTSDIVPENWIRF